MRPFPVSLASIMLTIFLLAGIVLGKDHSLEFDVVYGEEDRQAVRTFDLTDIAPGDVCTSDVLFRNETDRILTFENVELGCRCMDAKVNNGPLAPGEATLMQFRFETLSHPKSRSQLLQVKLTTTDDSRSVVFQFRVNFSQLVAFSSDSFQHEFVTQDQLLASTQSFQIPLIVSSDMEPSRVRILNAPELKFINFTLGNVEGKSYVTGSYRTSELKQDTTTGEVTLDIEGLASRPSIRVSITGADRYQLFPDKLSLSDEDEALTGSVILRVRGLKFDEGIRDVSCEFPDGTKCKVTVKSIATGISRLNFFVPKTSKSKTEEFNELLLNIDHFGKSTTRLIKFRVV